MGEGGFEISEKDAMRPILKREDNTAAMSAESNIRAMERRALAEAKAVPLAGKDVETAPEQDNKSKESIIFGMNSIKARVYEMVHEEANWTDGYLKDLAESQRMDQLTALRCKSNSAYVLDTVSRYYPDRFDTMFILSGVKTDGFKDAPRNSEHSYFVIKDKKGKYFAGSPANTQDGDTQNFSTLLESDNLPDILAQISERSGGFWPTADQVQEGLLKTPPEVKIEGSTNAPKIEFTTIAYSYPDYSSTREGYDFSDMKDPNFIEAKTV